MKRIMALVAALLVAPPALAEDREAEFFREMDTDGDGVISPEEFTLRKGVILYMLDANHDLKIERKETKLTPEQFAKYAGPDGVIDGAELFNLPEAKFSAFDRNGDHKITRQEFHDQLAALRSGQPQTAERR